MGEPRHASSVTEKIVELYEDHRSVRVSTYAVEKKKPEKIQA